MASRTGEVKYFERFTPIYRDTKLRYYDDGAKLFDVELRELENAKNFIFMEFFIFRSGELLTEVFDILRRKAKEGVKIYILYDNIGSFFRVKPSEIQSLRDAGIRVRHSIPIFSKFIRYVNNRDHTKIVVIDGRVAFTGGINVSDEYVHKISRFGFWKDSGIEIRGSAVAGFSDIFMKMWNLQDRIKLSIDKHPTSRIRSNYNYVPFLNEPKSMSDERIAHDSHLLSITSAKKTVHLITPYIACDEELLNALCLTAKRGVEVSIIFPHRYDHFFTNLAGKANFLRLVRSGVKIYEYLPGFIHAKGLVVDGKKCIVGSINYDNRSMNIDFEVGLFTDDKKFSASLEKDFARTIKKCKLITEPDCHPSFHIRLLTLISRLLYPQL